MNRFLFLDTETSMRPFDPSRPPGEHEHYPQIFELAYIVTDEAGEIITSFSSLVKPTTLQPGRPLLDNLRQLKHFKTGPDGESMLDLSHMPLARQADMYGQSLARALVDLSFAAEGCTAIVAHNIDFDLPVIRAGFARARIEPRNLPTLAYCTQKQTVTFAKIPYRRNRQGGALWRWPTLSELYQACGFGALENAHSAAADVEAARRCFFFLKNTHPYLFDLPWLR